MIRLVERFKAWRRNEIMIPKVSRGRCFIAKGELPSKEEDGIRRTNAKPKLELVGVKVIRTDGSTEEIR